MSYNRNSLFDNRPVEKLDIDTDLFGLIPKGNAITSILSNSKDFTNNNMMALYGNWGSGKTSLMYYIKNNLEELATENNNKKRFKAIFFEAWKYEKDKNLALSLFEQIVYEIEKDFTLAKKSFEKAEKAIYTIKTFLKNCIYTTKAKVEICGVELFEIEPGAAGQKTKEQVNEKYSKKSMYESILQLENSFKELDKLIEKQYENLIVFIDDLDRCEPENVLDLLAAIKLFFTYSNKTIYFCGVDKLAITKAIDIRYHKIIKSDEYLEKIFDITFNMPKTNNIEKVIKRYFKDIEITDKTKNKEYILRYYECINKFFITIGFTTPRHVKKVFNKLELLRRFKNETNDELFPHIDKNKNIISIIFTLYLIILHEFYYDKFEEMLLLDEKFESYKEYMEIKPTEGQKGNQSLELATGNVSLSSFLGKTKLTFLCEDSVYNNMLICKEIFYESKLKLLQLIHIFMPKAKKNFYIRPNSYNMSDDIINNFKMYINQFTEDNLIVTSFCNYLLDVGQYRDVFDKTDEKFSLLNLIEVINLYL